MLNRSEQALRQWKGFDEAIDRWLEKRHDLIVLLADFASHRPFQKGDNQLLDKIDAFTSLLIDYVSAGHFEFYQRLIDEGVEFDDHASVAHSRDLLKLIEHSTNAALAFNDSHGEQADLDVFPDDLSRLAESLEERFEAEDWMISTLHSVHMDRQGG